MELSKYNKLEKLGFTFWTKKKDTEIGFQSYLIGESVIAFSSSGRSDKDLTVSERFIYSVRSLLSEEVVKKISNEEIAKEDIKTAFLFGLLKMDVLEEHPIKIFTYPSIDDICNTSCAKKEFYKQFKEDLIT
tara:strand:+ start:2181 stop:2576 length:396 start_codon:yes stop_codon:yes gene_type:complete